MGHSFDEESTYSYVEGRTKYTYKECTRCHEHIETGKSFWCSRCQWYAERQNVGGIAGIIYKMVHAITHAVQGIGWMS